MDIGKISIVGVLVRICCSGGRRPPPWLRLAFEGFYYIPFTMSNCSELILYFSDKLFSGTAGRAVPLNNLGVGRAKCPVIRQSTRLGLLQA